MGKRKVTGRNGVVRHAQFAPAPPPAAAAAPTVAQKQDLLRTLGALNERLNFAGQFAGVDGFGFEGSRNYYTALGYKRSLTPELYWDRYRRNGVARRLVNSLPNATWRSGADLVEDDAPETVTDFEAAWVALAARLNAWDRMRKADILAQLGRFSVILIGFPGAYETEAKKVHSPEDVAYLKQFSETGVKVQTTDLETDRSSPRYGMPKRYQFTRLLKPGGVQANQFVHWSRVIHVADEAVEDDQYGEPLLASVWNWLDDLEKVAGSGSEAFWRRVQPMLQAALVPGAVLPTGGEQEVEAEIDKLIHGMRRWVRVSGIDLKEVGTTDVAMFDKQIDALIGLIVASYGIPKRILVGSEQGELASGQDRSNWAQHIRDRRSQFAETLVLRPLVDRLVNYNALPKPTEYDVRWPDVADLDTKERLDLALVAARTNEAQGEQVMTTNEIRDQLLSLDALEEDELRTVEPATPESLMRRLRRAKGAAPRRGRLSGLRIERDAAGARLVVERAED